MTVIMTYQTLVDREYKKNSSADKWRLFGIIILICISICGLVAAFKINSLIEHNYNGNCIVNAQLLFRKNDTSYNPRIRKFSKTKEILGPGDLFIPDQTNPRKYASRDDEFFDTMIIDTYHSFWGTRSDCEYVSIAPLFSSCIATIWIAMFLICGTGNGANSFAPKPWRIVTPSAVFFIVMTFISFFHLIYLKITLDRFCDQIQVHLEKTYSWSVLLDHFSMLHSDSESFAHGSYPTIIALLSIINVLWLLVFIVMILRCIFVADFQLVSTTISNHDEDDERGYIAKSSETVFADCRDSAGVRFNIDREDDETSFVTAPQRTPSNVTNESFKQNSNK